MNQDHRRLVRNLLRGFVIGDRLGARVSEPIRELKLRESEFLSEGSDLGSGVGEGLVFHAVGLRSAIQYNPRRGIIEINRAFLLSDRLRVLPNRRPRDYHKFLEIASRRLFPHHRHNPGPRTWALLYSFIGEGVGGESVVDSERIYIIIVGTLFCGETILWFWRQSDHGSVYPAYARVPRRFLWLPVAEVTVAPNGFG